MTLMNSRILLLRLLSALLAGRSLSLYSAERDTDSRSAEHAVKLACLRETISSADRALRTNFVCLFVNVTEKDLPSLTNALSAARRLVLSDARARKDRDGNTFDTVTGTRGARITVTNIAVSDLVADCQAFVARGEGDSSGYWVKLTQTARGWEVLSSTFFCVRYQKGNATNTPFAKTTTLTLFPGSSVNQVSR